MLCSNRYKCLTKRTNGSNEKARKKQRQRIKIGIAFKYSPWYNSKF